MNALAPASRDLAHTDRNRSQEGACEAASQRPGWRPREESAQEAMARYGQSIASRAGRRVCPHAAGAPSCPSAERTPWPYSRASLGVAGPAGVGLSADCPEGTGQALRRVSPGASRAQRATPRRALGALHHALDLYLSSAEMTRAKIDDAVTWIRITCDDAGLPDDANGGIPGVRATASRAAAMRRIGGSLDNSDASAGAPARKRIWPRPAARATFHIDFAAREDEDPEFRREGGPGSALAARRRTSPRRIRCALARSSVIGGRRGGGSRTRSRSGAIVAAGCAGRDIPSLAEETDRFAETLAGAKRYADAAM